MTGQILGRVMLTTVFASLLPSFIGAAQAADVEAGQRIADRWCTSCHVVDNRSGGTDAVPALASIAQDQRRGPDWVRQWLSAPHPPMPDLNLSHAEIENVVAYLKSLSR